MKKKDCFTILFQVNLKIFFTEKMADSSVKKCIIQQLTNQKKYFTLGGLFFIKKTIWFSVKGMKNHFRRSQDLDLGLRLAKINIFLKIKKDLIATHHTVSYFDKNRIWKDLFSGNDFYRALLFRENLFNIYMWKIFFKRKLYVNSFLFFYDSGFSWIFFESTFGIFTNNLFENNTKQISVKKYY